MLALCLLLVLSSNALSSRKDKSILYARSGIIIMIMCSFISFINYDIDFFNKELGIYHGFLYNSAISQFFHIFIFIVSGLILQLNSFYPRKVWDEGFTSLYNILFSKIVYYNNYILNKTSGQYNILEYPLIIMFVITGGVCLITCSDLVSMFLCIELQSYGLYILCSVYKESEKATSGGLTYFLLGGLSSCFILFASSILYGNSGNTNFDGLYMLNNVNQFYVEEIGYKDESVLGVIYNSYYINFALSIMSIGFLFKVTAAPFHFWSPDVYDAIPTVVTTFVAIFAKISIFIFLLELVYHTNSINTVEVTSDTSYTNAIYGGNNSWKYTLILSAISSFIIGSILGMTQFRIKRLYAYSTISHVGFILLALSINSIQSIQSFMFYLMQYSLSNLNAFVILLAIGYSLYLYIEPGAIDATQSEKTENTTNNIIEKNTVTPIISDKTNSPIQLITQLKGYFYVNPSLAISLAVTIFSFVGVPPLIGFFGKQMVLSAALDNGYIFITLIAIITSVISAYYYLSLVKQIFFDSTNYIINSHMKNIKLSSIIVNTYNNKYINSINLNINNVVLSSSLTTTISVLTLGITLFMINPQELLNMISILSLILFNN